MTRFLTHLGGARFTVGLALMMIAFGGEARAAGAAALLGNALSHALVQVLKRTVQRPRPCDAAGIPLALVVLPDPFSFPSGHAAAAFAVAVPVALAWPVLAPVALGLATYVGHTRVALRVHHLTDVLAGVVLGVAGALVALQLVGS